MFLNRDFAKARDIIQKYETFDSRKFVEFIQTFDPLVSFFFYYLVLFFCIFNKILKLLFFFPGK